MKKQIIHMAIFFVLVFFGTSVSEVFASGSADESGAKTFILKLGVAVPTDHPHAISAREFAKLVNEKTGGRVVVKVSDNGSLGNNSELLDAVKTGVVDLTIIPPGIMKSYSPLVGILELPYLFVSMDHMLAVTRGDIGDEISEIYSKDAGIDILGYLGGAQRNMITKGKVINSIDDLAGLKMRTWESDLMINWWKSLGAIGSVVAFPEVYTALQTGVVDGAENEFSSFTTARWAEVAKNVALTEHNITVRPLIINSKKLASLPEDIQAAIREAGKEVADFDVDLERKLDIANKKKLEDDYGVTYTSLNKEPFIQASVKTITDFAKTENIEDFATRIKNLAK